jgi:hypothetical protein
MEGPLASSEAAPEPASTQDRPAMPRQARHRAPAEEPPDGGPACPPMDSSPASPPTESTLDRAGTEDSKDAADKDAPGADAASTDAPGTDAADKDAAGAPAPASPAAGAPETAGRPANRRQRLAATARRLSPNRRNLVSASGALRAWSGRPSGRLALPASMLVVLVAAAAVAGGVLVPAAARTPRLVAGGGSASPRVNMPSPVQPTPSNPVGTPTPGLPGMGAGRPADVLADWGRQTAPRVGIPPVALQAYGYAELVLAQTNPKCRLTWTTLAAIGQVESNHGSANGAKLLPDGLSEPPIIGLPLDGKGGRQRLTDTDAGALDGDPIYDRALGPMQFIPSTWRTNGADADNDGQKNPQNIYDSALAAGNYLCNDDRDLSVARDWWSAILSYNEVRPYAESVYAAANLYGAKSRT